MGSSNKGWVPEKSSNKVSAPATEVFRSAPAAPVTVTRSERVEKRPGRCDS